MYDELAKMFNSGDVKNVSLAMDIMANTDYEQSEFKILMLLSRFYASAIINNPSKNLVNFKNFLKYFNKYLSSISNPLLFCEKMLINLKEDSKDAEERRKYCIETVKEYIERHMLYNTKFKIKELEFKIKKYNAAYRTGDALISDSEYDELIEELESLDPENELLDTVGFKPQDDGRMQKLPIIMASMNKIKTIDEYFKWLKSKNIPEDTLMVCTPKFDGASFCVNEQTEDAWTRGDGIEGQYSPEHYQMVKNKNPKSEIECNFYSYGEISPFQSGDCSLHTQTMTVTVLSEAS